MVSIVLEHFSQEDEDRRSIRSTSSTVATTTSLASRLAALALDFSDKLHEHYEDSIQETKESEYSSDTDDSGSTSERATVTEEEQERSMQSFRDCSKLFIHKGNQPLQLKKLTVSQVEDLKQNGYVIVDNFISKDIAHQIKTLICTMHNRGLLVDGKQACNQHPDVQYADKVTRSDEVFWLTMGQPPADTPALSHLLVAYQDLQDEIQQFVRLKKASADYQVAYHPPSTHGFSRHRDAAPDRGSENNTLQALSKRLTALVCCNVDADKDQGGKIRIWLPRGSAHLGRRSNTGSECGTSHSEFSDSVSLRSHLYAPGSTTSSMLAEMSTTHEHDAASVDGVSMVEMETQARPGLEWQELEGGEMVLDVAPLAGRCIIMLSGAIDHAHLGSTRDAVFVTAWFQ